MSKQDQQGEVIIKVELDENKIPEKIHWRANQQGSDDFKECKAFMLSIWDGTDNQSLRMELWNKEMRRDEMNAFIFQTMMHMSDTYERANGDKEISGEMRTFATEFYKKVNEKTQQGKA